MPDIDPEGRRLPIKLDSTSNGEFAPVPLWPANLEANRLAHEAAARIRSVWDAPRGAFLTSACGAASTLLAFNAANAAAGRTGGFFDLPKRRRPGPAARARAGRARQAGVHPRRAGPLHRHAEGQLEERRGVPQGRVHGQRHRRDGAVLRPLRPRRRAGDDPGRRRSAPAGRQARGHAPAAAARPRQPEPARRPRGHGRAAARSGASAPGRPTRSTVRTARATSCTTTSAFASSRRRAPWASRTSASTRGCPSAAAPTSTASAATSASSPSAIRT